MRNGMKKAAALLIAALLFLAALPASMEGQEQYSQNVIPGISLTSILPGDTPVATYVFHNDGVEYARQSVKNGETLYEPAAPAAPAGSVFAGWFTDAGEQFTSFGAQTVTQTQTISLYARFATQYYVNFYTPDGSVLKHVETVSDRGPHDFSKVSYDVSQTSSVTGWAYEKNGTTDVSKNVTIPEGAVQVDLYAIVEDGYWVVFDTNGGSPVNPVFARAGESVSLNDVSAPTRSGYTFDGWLNVEGEEVTEVSNGQTVTASWLADDTTFTIVFWYENADDDLYSVAGSTRVSARTGETAVSSSYQNEDFEGRDSQHFTYDSTKEESITVSGDGTSILNVYYSRKRYTLTFQVGESSWWPVGQDYETVATITAKYDAEISGAFNQPPFTTTYQGRAWLDAGNTYDYALQTLDRMPGTNVTFRLYNKSSEVKKTIYYYVENIGVDVANNRWPDEPGEDFDLLKSVDTYFNYATYDEEYHEILGFTRYAGSTAGFNRQNQKGFTPGNTLDLYYLRNSYTFRFHNSIQELPGFAETVEYQDGVQKFTEGRTPVCPLDNPEMYTFGGWYTDPYHQNPVTEEMTMPASDVMLYAYWKPLTFEVTFDLGYEDAPASPEMQTVNALDKAVEPEEPTREGYNFLGWYDSEVDSLFSFETQIVKNTELVARWLAEGSFVVQYDANGGEGTPPADGTQYADGADAVLLDGSSLTHPAGKVFLGWALGQTAAEAQYQPGGSMPIQAAQAVEGVITLYAVWGDVPGTTTLTYNANYIASGSQAAATQQHTIDGSAALPDNAKIALYGEDTFTRPGYKLIGWADDPNATTPQYELNAEVYIDIPDAGEENVLYAVWERSTVSVTIQKQVTGNMGDYTKAFEFKVTSTDALGAGTGYSLSDDGHTACFTLQNSQSVTLPQVPVGAMLTVEETNADGYTTTLSVGNTPLEGKSYICDADTVIVVTNHREGTPDTGISTDGLPYALLLGCAVAGTVLLLLRRRKRA